MPLKPVTSFTAQGSRRSSPTLSTRNQLHQRSLLRTSRSPSRLNIPNDPGFPTSGFDSTPGHLWRHRDLVGHHQLRSGRLDDSRSLLAQRQRPKQRPKHLQQRGHWGRGNKNAREFRWEVLLPVQISVLLKLDIGRTAFPDSARRGRPVPETPQPTALAGATSLVDLIDQGIYGNSPQLSKFAEWPSLHHVT